MPTQDDVTRWQTESDNRKKEAKEHLLSLTETLRTAEIGWVVGFFDGSGDEGQIVDIYFLPTNYEAASVETARSSYDWSKSDSDITAPATINLDTLSDAIWTLTPDGFQDCAGGFGAVVFNVSTGKIKVNYSYRIEDSADDDYEV